MSIGRKSFLFFIFFIIGIFIAGFKIDLIYILLGNCFISLILIFFGILKSDRDFFIVSFLILTIFAGAFYLRAFNYISSSSTSVIFDKNVKISGIIDSYPKISEKSQEFIIKIDSGKLISVRTYLQKNFSYGDKLVVNGKINSLDDKNNYLKKDGITGVINYPSFISIKKSQATFLGFLYSFKNIFLETFKKNLNQDEAALMSGMLLGQEGAGFSDNFKSAMKNSGTTHLVALSGYNITILISSLFFILSFFMPKRIGFWISLLAIILFVLMTGAQSSVIRAAFMGSLLIISKRLSRIYSFAQAMSFSAFLMLALNPTILKFDIGFVLSFVSLAGITYLMPILSFSFLSKNKTNILSEFKKIFFETLSAQLAVLPILSFYFGGFSFTGLMSNILILPLVPITMFLGFFVGFLGIIWVPLARIGSLFAFIPLKFESWVINFFGSFSQAQIQFGLWAAIFYYSLIILFIYKFRDKLRTNEYAV